MQPPAAQEAAATAAAQEAAATTADDDAWEDAHEEQCYESPCSPGESDTSTRRGGKSAARIGREMEAQCSRQIGK